jgi:hypothetical protein
MNNNRKDSEDHINRETGDIKDWKHIFEEKMNCNKDDSDCWKKLLPSLPCNIGDTKCWKRNYPTIPCSSVDEECWRKVLP